MKFKKGDYVVYPCHGVGRFLGQESYSIDGESITFLNVEFERDRMVLKLPQKKAETAGLRPILGKKEIKEVLDSLKNKPKTKRMMWSRRAQEYESKINSGDPYSVAEVVSELHKNPKQAEQSYSERQIYQAALERLGRELAAIEKIEEAKAFEKIEKRMLGVG
jgi:CarD family transcriptional regulator